MPLAGALAVDDVQLSDEVIGIIVEWVRPHLCDGHGESSQLLVAHREEMTAPIADESTGVKLAERLDHPDEVVPTGTVRRFVREVCGRHHAAHLKKGRDAGWRSLPTTAPSPTG